MKMQFKNADEEAIPYDGSPLTWRVSAYVLVIQNNQLLVVKDTTEKLYDIPGGGIELDESIEEAIEREGKEEAGAVVRAEKLIHARVDCFYHKAQQKFLRTVQLFYTGSLIGDLGKPTQVSIEKVLFVPFSEMKKYPLPIGVKEALQKLQKELEL
jgi:8-oxo-dGTP pyrophosphatase MutT (NUDIX family)